MNAVGSIFARMLDWVATAACTGWVVSSLCAYEVIQRFALAIGGVPLQQKAAVSMARAVNTGLWFAGQRVSVSGMEHIDAKQNYIVVMNHQSLFDISMTNQLLPNQQPRFISKIELGRSIPGISYNLRKGESALINRKDSRQSHQVIAELGMKVKDRHWTVLIFPEGTRSKDGMMKPFKIGGLKTLIENAPGVPVLPMSSSGGSKMFSKNLKPIVRGVEMAFTIYPPVMPPDPKDDELFLKFVQNLETTIRAGVPSKETAA